MDVHNLPTDYGEAPDESQALVDRPMKVRYTGYFSFPAEIRNKIMLYVLVPGQIHIQPPPIPTPKAQNLAMQRNAQKQLSDTTGTTITNDTPSLSKSTDRGPFSSRTQFKPATAETGCQFLATCHQVYREGRDLFYSQNTFYIPSSPLPHAVAYFDQLQPSNLALIKTICIKFTLEDVTSAHVKAIDNWVAMMGFDSSTMAPSLWRRHVLKAVGEVWNAKLRWVRNYTHFERVIFESPLGALDLEGANMQETLKGALNGTVGHPVDGYEECSEDVAAFMRATSRDLKLFLEAQSFTHWNIARKWLLATPYRAF